MTGFIFGTVLAAALLAQPTADQVAQAVPNQVAQAVPFDVSPARPPVVAGHEGGEPHSELGPRLWPILAASGPGIFVHGAGHFVAGESRTAWRLLAMQWIGLGTAVGGLAGLGLTGASPKTTRPFIDMVALGAGLLGASWLADIYGVSVPEGGSGSPTIRPRVEVEVGGRYVIDPVFAYDAFAYQAVAGRWRRTTLLGEAFIGLDHDNQRLRLLGAYMLWREVVERDPDGLATRNPASALWLELGGVHHRFGSEGFSTSFGEIALAGRYDLGRLGRTLRGSFLDGAVGFALGANRYFDNATEVDELTLARAGFGFYLGHRADRGGEAQVYYDHRHDGFAAGLKIRGVGSGPGGHFGLRVRYYLSRRWGFAFEGEGGSAYVAGLSLLARLGNVP